MAASEIREDGTVAATDKTNAMRLLEKAGVPYKVHTYEAGDTVPDGETVAARIGEDPAKVFKTLVTVGPTRGVCVFVVPVCRELDLKAAARAVGEKSLAMLKPADLERTTGYVRGGCSPFGMKKAFPTVVDGSAEGLATLIVSAGKIGFQVEVPPSALVQLARAVFCDVTHAGFPSGM